MDFSYLGFGLGIRTEYYDHYLKSKPQGIDWGEVILENFLPLSTGKHVRALKKLEQIRSHIPVVLHGVSMSLGSATPLDKSYLKRLKELIQIIQPPHVSDHLCWTNIGGHNSHDLLPLPFTEEVIKNIVSKISYVQEFLGKKILVENVSAYLEFEHSEMTEWEFVAEILKRSGCGILLDVNNVYVSSLNQKFNPLDYLKAIPSHKIGQIHLAGHTDKGHYCVDTHDEPICKEVFRLYEWVVKNKGTFSTMIERDDNFPSWEELNQELMVVKNIWKKQNAKQEFREITVAL